MSVDFLKLSVTGVQGLSPYQAGKPIDELERELGIKGIVKLASNENPLGPSPKVLEAISAELSEITRYPDSNGYHLKKAISENLKVPAANITLGNGSNDILDLIGRAFLDQSVEAVYSQYSFVVYPMVTKACCAKGVEVKANNFGHDLGEMANAITEKTRVVFLANPNNPTGTWFNQHDLTDFLNSVPQKVIVVLDEAYFEYVDTKEYPDGVSLLKKYPNLIVTRTFSKAYGLAAMRIGYSVSSPELADILNRIRQPFNSSSLAQIAAITALSDSQYLQKSRKMNQEGMNLLEEGFLKLSLSYIPSKGNFISVDVQKDALKVYQDLLLEGVIVRPVPMPGFLRVSIGLPEENKKLLRALEKVLG